MRLDLLLLHEPVQHLGRAVDTVNSQPLWLQAKALGRALQHGSGSARFGLTHRPGGFHVHDCGGLEPAADHEDIFNEIDPEQTF